MSLFRSEEHLESWLAKTGYSKGMSVPLEHVWRLAKLWYTDPRAENWRTRTRDESQAVLSAAGLTDPFWELPSQ